MTGGLLSARLSAIDWAMETFRGGEVVPQVAGRAGEQARRCGGGGGASTVRHRRGHRRGRADASEGFAPGTVFLAVDVEGAQQTEKVMLTPDRRRTREFSVISLLNLLRRALV